MNLTGRPPYQKGQRIKKLPNVATVKQRARWERLRALGCIVRRMGIAHPCFGGVTIQHCFTGAGGRKDHDQVVPMCWSTHIGPDGIDGRQNYSKRTWQEHFTTEQAMIDATLKLEDETYN